jgi:hypothetical protein
VGIGAIGSIGEARTLIEQSFPAEVYEPSGKGSWERAYAGFRQLARAASK